MPGRWKDLLRLARVPLVWTATADSVAGYLLATPVVRGFPLAMLATASACFYMAGMVFNDVADRERDRTLHPERPLVSGAVGVREAVLLGSVLMMLAMTACVMVGLVTYVVGAALAAAIFVYDFGLKRFGVLGALSMGLARALNFVLGLSAASEGTLTGFEFGAVVLGGYVFLLTCLSLLEEKPQPGMFLAVSLLMVAWPQVVQGMGPSPAGRGAAVAVSGVIAAVTLWAGRRYGTPTAVRWGVITIILIDATLVVGFRGWMPGAALVGLVPLCLLTGGLVRRAT